MLSPEDLIRSASAHLARGQRAEAMAMLQSALAQAPGHPAANHHYAILLAQSGQFEPAIGHLKIAADANPGDAGLHCNLGMLQSTLGRHAEAEVSLRHALGLNPRHADALTCLAVMCATQQRAAEAEELFRAALDAAPGRPDISSAFARLLTETGRADEALAVVRAAQDRNPGDLMMQSKLCMTLNYVDGVDPQELLAQHRRFGKLAPPGDPIPVADPDPGRRLRIGYLSGDLREHSVAYFLEPLLENHDRDAFEVFCYHVGPPDTATPRLAAEADHWRPLLPITDEALLSAIRADHLDILIELGGHTSSSRLIAIARRTAPIQVSAIGYPNTTGLPSIDARIVDAITDPPGSEMFATERLVRLDHCFLCYRPPESAPEPSLPPSVAAGNITFGSFNSLAKLSPPTIDLWARILSAVPGSRLALKGKALTDLSVAARFHERFAARGITADRLDLMGHTPSTRDHLAAYSRIDIALDPFPYHGTTTTCEALHMGVPVVTLAGDRHASRVGISLLTTANLTEFIAADPGEYLRIATELARDPERLAHLRSSLRGALDCSPLRDGPAYTRRVEAALRDLWRTHTTP